MKEIRFVSTTLLAWLGLAGLMGNLVTWRNWFNQGIMQHWSSAKEWTIAILLDWVPFHIPTSVLDYLMLGAISSSGYVVKGSEEYHEKYEHVPRLIRFGDEVLTFVASIPSRLVIALLWPWFIFNIVYSHLNDYHRTTASVEDVREMRRDVRTFARKVLWYAISFIPVLFVCSTLLYEFG